MTYIKQLKDHETKLKNEIEKEGLTITISGFSSSGKSTVGKALAEEFDLEHVSAGTFFRKWAKEEGLTIEQFCEKRTEEDDIKLDKATLRRGLKGNVVLDGRLTGWVLGDHADLRIWIGSPRDFRAKLMALREEWSFEKANEELVKRDNADKKAYKKAYGIDLEDDIYDIVIENTFSTPEELQKEAIKVIREIIEEN